MKKLIGFQKGVNLGGWLSQGSKEKEHLDTFIVEDDIKRISEMGCDHLRLPVDFENIEDDHGNIKESGFGYIEACIKWCQKYGINCVLDLHKTPGYIFDDQEYSKDFFDSEVLQNRFYDIWDRLSKRFAKYSDMMMFEMLNEVVQFSVSDKWNVIGTKCIEVIRKNAPTVKILFGGVCYSAVNSVKLLPKPYDENIVYNVHCYEPLVFTHQGAYWVDKMPLDFRITYPVVTEEDRKRYLDMTDQVPAAGAGAMREMQEENLRLMGKDLFLKIFKEPADVCEENGAYLYCGEYGVIDRADPESALRWLKDINYAFEYYNIGRCLWSYKEMDYGIIGDHYKDIFDELIKSL